MIRKRYIKNFTLNKKLSFLKNNSVQVCPSIFNFQKQVENQIKIQREEIRAKGKKRDDLQEAISAIQGIDIGLPIEFINFRD